MSDDQIYAVTAVKATTDEEVVFALREDLDEATRLTEQLAFLGLRSRYVRVWRNTVWSGMNWPPPTARE